MRNRFTGIFVLLALLLSVVIGSGVCFGGESKSKSKPAGSEPKPSDEEIIKAIDDSGIMKRVDGSFTVVPPVTVVQRGKRNKDGSWPVKVKFTVTYKMKDEKISPPTETTTSFRILRAKDDAGKPVWKAQMGS